MPQLQYLPSAQFKKKLNKQYSEANRNTSSIDKNLLESKRMLSTLVGNLPGMAYRCKNDQNWSMEFVSPGCLKLTGFSDHELVNNKPPYEKIITHEYKEHVWQQVQSAIENHQPFNIAYQIKTKSGVIKDVTERGIGIYSDSGEIEAIEGFIWDDTQLKQTQKHVQILNEQLKQEIQEKEEKQQKVIENQGYLRDIIDAVPHMIFIKNIQGKYLLANQCVANAYGKNIDEVLGHDQYELKHLKPHELKKFLKDDREVINSGKKKFIPIEEFTDKSGITRSFQTHKLPFLYEGQQCILGTVVDISQLVETQKEVHQLNLDLEKKVSERTHELSLSNKKLNETLDNLKQTQEQLIQAEKMTSLARLVAGLAHQINTPIGNALTGISSLSIVTQTLFKNYQQGIKQKDFETYLHNVTQLSQVSMQNIEKAALLVNNLKRLSNEELVEEKRKFNVYLYTQDVILSLQAQLQEKNITIQTNIPKELDIVSYQDIYGQLLTILIMNSLIHAFTDKEKGCIQINLEILEDKLYLHYSDNGKGITQNDLPHIFDPFYKANLSSTGTGLGLHILYNLVTTSFRGKVNCQSQINQGVNFTLEIPPDNFSII